MAFKTSVLVRLLAAVAAAHPQTKLAAPRAVETTCAAQATTVYGLETPIPNPEEWYASINQKYATATQFTGENVKIHTMVMSEDGEPVMTGFHALPSDLLEAEGIKVTNSVVTTTSCGAPMETGSPEKICDPHDDHWHCPEGVEEPKDPPTEIRLEEAGETVAEECTPHGDHWHCPEGVDEPDFAPTEGDFEDDSAELTECVPHGDHWHCPPGMEEPPYAADEESSAGSQKAIAGFVVAVAVTLTWFHGNWYIASFCV